MAEINITKKEKTGILADVLNAVSQEPVFIREDGEVVAVLLSPETYAEYEEERRTRIKEVLKRMDDMGEEAIEKGFTEEILAEILADGNPVEKERTLAELRTIFDKSHKHNSHLDVDATQNLIEEEVQAHRNSKKPKL